MKDRGVNKKRACKRDFQIEFKIHNKHINILQTRKALE